MLKFILMVNKQGQTRLSQYYDFLPIAERVALEGEIIRKCLGRSESQCSFMQYREYKVVYRRYASLFFIVGALNQTTAVAAFSASSAAQTATTTLPSAVSSGVVQDAHSLDVVNELAILEFIHCLVETLDKYFENVCELDIMFNLEKAHFILDEMVVDGCIVETNKANVLQPILLLEKHAVSSSGGAGSAGVNPTNSVLSGRGTALSTPSPG